MIQWMRNAGGLPRYTERVGWGHNNWNRIYGEEGDWTDTYQYGDPADTRLELTNWMFAQQRTPGPESKPLAPGKTLLVDFGGNDTTLSPDGAGQYWNNASTNATGTGTLLTSMRNTDGFKTLTRIDVLDAFNGSNSSGVVDNSLYAQNAQKDTWWVGSFDGHASALLESGSFAIKGLIPHGLYRIRCFGSRQGADGNLSRSTRYTIGTEFRN